MNKINWNLTTIYWCGYWFSLVIIAIYTNSGAGLDLITSIGVAIFYAFFWPLLATIVVGAMIAVGFGIL